MVSLLVSEVGGSLDCVIVLGFLGFVVGVVSRVFLLRSYSLLLDWVGFLSWDSGVLFGVELGVSLVLVLGVVEL